MSNSMPFTPKTAILQVLSAGNAMFGMKILSEVRRRTGYDISQGAIYMNLHAMEAQELLESYREETQSGAGKRKIIYSLTDKGYELAEKYRQSMANLLQ
jgi:DNA-binding PadR family transcriptional regulator